jgi:2,3-bisphosphoglycerate-independent phosphoglycerate mutase
MDGRDVPPSSGEGFIKDLEERLSKAGAGKIATVAGRFYAMDRDNIWERVQRAYDAMVLGKGVPAESAVQAMIQSYEKGETDEFVQPSVVMKDGKPLAVIAPDDSVVFFNFRPDRARQLTRVFVDPDFKGFPRANGYFPTFFVTMTPYDVTLPNVHVAFSPQVWKNTLGEYLSAMGLHQLRIAETQKYAHVTYFFNGGVEAVNKGEDRVLVDSPKIATFDMKPEMSAYEVTDEVEKRIASGEYDVIIMNYANCDMVGHTGIMQAAVKAVEAVDTCVGRVVDAVRKMGGNLIITADHGNAEEMWDDVEHVPYTAHTVSNPVPFIVVDDRYLGAKLKDDGCLADVAPTMLAMMGIEQPKEMTGKSLLP